MLKIGDKIAQLRKSKSWSQTYLAKAIDAYLRDAKARLAYGS